MASQYVVQKLHVAPVRRLTSIKFEIRFAPQLGKKPTKDNVKAETKPADPFAPPYKPDLYIAEDSVQDGDEEEQFVLLVRVARCQDEGTQQLIAHSDSSTNTA